MRRRRGRKRARGTRSPMPIPIRPTIRWSLDPRHCHSDQWRSIGSISDTFGASRKFRILAVNDDCARENLCLIADTSISGARVARELTALIRIYGKPDCIVSELPLLRHWSERQWRRHRVHQPGDPQMGWRYRCRLALHRSGPIAGKTIPRIVFWPGSYAAKWSDRELQRQPAGRMPERGDLRQPRRRASNAGPLALRLQQCQAAFVTGKPDASRSAPDACAK